MILSPQLPVPQSATMSLDGESFTGHNLTTSWSMPVELSSLVDYDWGTTGRWKPFRSTLGPRKVDENPQKTMWKSSIDQRELLTRITNPEYIKSEIRRLTKLAITSDDLSLISYPIQGTNWLGMWSHMMRFAPGRDPSKNQARAQSGELIAQVIAADIPSNVEFTISRIYQILEEYQIAVDEMGVFHFLLDETAIRSMATALTFTSELFHESNLTQTIGCWYIKPGLPYGLVVTGSTGEFPLFVKAAANSQAKATLETSLQRARLLKGELKATAQLPFDISWRPGDTVEREGRKLKVVRVDHSTAAGPTPNTTNLTLRGIPPVVLQ